MNKIFHTIFIICIFSIIPVSSEDFFDSYTGVSNIDNEWSMQKPVTDKEFEQAMDVLTEKQKKREEKQKKKKIKKISGGGTSLHKGLEPMSEILQQESLKDNKDEGRLVNIPVDFYIDNNLLEKGYYNIFAENDKDGNVYLLFYQAHYLKGKVKAYKTKNDFGSDDIDFAKMMPYDEHYIKIVFGSLDVNAYAYLRY